jgi:hypothetical protein
MIEETMKLLAWIATSDTPGQSAVVLTDKKTRQITVE